MLLLFKEYTILSGENVIVFPNSDKYFHNFGDFSTSKQTALACKNLFFKKIFLSPGHDRVVTIKSRNFFYCESLTLSGFLYWVTRGCNLTAHSPIHASFILRRGLTRSQLPKILLRLENVERRNPSD